MSTVSAASCCLAAVLLLGGCADLGGGSNTAADAGVDAASTAACAIDAAETTDSAAFQDAFADPQYAILERQPTFGATVCNPVTHWWTFVATGVPPGLFIGPGARHTAGKLPTSGTFQTADQHTFHLNPPMQWAGPGTHVHLVAYDAKKKLILDPFFEYDVAIAQ